MAQKDKNPNILFLSKFGKPVQIPLSVVLSAQKMKDRAYALGAREIFADEDVRKKVKGLKHEGRPVIEILKDRYNV